MKYILLVFSILFFAGCGPGRLSTMSGKPEISVSGIEKVKVMDAIAAWSASQGQSVVVTNDYGLTTQGKKDAGAFGMSIPVKTVFTIIKKDTILNIFAMQSTVVDKKSWESGEAFNSSTFKTVGQEEKELNQQSDYERIQSELEDLKKFIVSQ